MVAGGEWGTVDLLLERQEKAVLGVVWMRALGGEVHLQEGENSAIIKSRRWRASTRKEIPTQSSYAPVLPVRFGCKTCHHNH